MPFHLVRGHYERHPYPHYPLLASIRRYDTYVMNLTALWARFNGELLSEREGRILLSGSGAFAPYPMACSNPRARIDAVDLAVNNIRRARLHCLLHARFNVRFRLGDFLDSAMLPGPYHLIEAFGVLHHLDDPLAGMRALEQRLVPGGILRVMVYGRYARQQSESVRRALGLLGIRDLAGLKRLLRTAPPDSRLRQHVDGLWEARTASGLADLFLHPNVKTYRIDEFLELVSQTGLTPLLYTHHNAIAEVKQEEQRLREMDRRRETDTNIICFLGHACRGEAEAPAGEVYVGLNPALREAVSLLQVTAPAPLDRLGHANQPLDLRTRLFLRRFRRPIRESELSGDERALALRYVKELFLFRYRA